MSVDVGISTYSIEWPLLGFTRRRLAGFLPFAIAARYAFSIGSPFFSKVTLMLPFVWREAGRISWRHHGAKCKAFRSNNCSLEEACPSLSNRLFGVRSGPSMVTAG